MITAAIKNSWDKLLAAEKLRYYPEENAERVWEDRDFPLQVGYIPERANRFVAHTAQDGASRSPLGEHIWEREDCIFTFDGLVLLANKRPIGRYHSILCSKEYLPQNSFAYEQIEEVSKIVEDTGMRSFLNMLGTAATLNHFHTQALFDPFNLEYLEKEYVTKNIGFLKGYPGGNLLVTGELQERCRLLLDRIQCLSESRLSPTVRHDGSLSDTPLYTLLFWENHILMIPRRREVSSITRAMSGGLELSGNVMITQPLSSHDVFAGVSYESILETIREVVFEQEDIAFLYEQELDAGTTPIIGERGNRVTP